MHEQPLRASAEKNRKPWDDDRVVAGAVIGALLNAMMFGTLDAAE